MVAQAKWPYLTPEEYLRREKAAENKSEYIDGVMVAVSGANRRHSTITSSIAGEIYPYLDAAGCRGYPPDMRVRIVASNIYYYPDHTVVCGEPQFEVVSGVDSLLNPTLIVEVLSDSTKRVDRGEKWLAYRQIESLKVYLLVHQDRPFVEMFVRNPASGEWAKEEIEGPDADLHLQSPACSISLARIYKHIVFEESNPTR